MRPLATLASAALASAVAAASTTRVYGFENIRRVLQQRGRSYRDRGSIATGNRWGGPHLHQREIARRLRQIANTAGAVS